MDERLESNRKHSHMKKIYLSSQDETCNWQYLLQFLPRKIKYIFHACSYGQIFTARLSAFSKPCTFNFTHYVIHFFQVLCAVRFLLPLYCGTQCEIGKDDSSPPLIYRPSPLFFFPFHWSHSTPEINLQKGGGEWDSWLMDLFHPSFLCFPNFSFVPVYPSLKSVERRWDSWFMGLYPIPQSVLRLSLSHSFFPAPGLFSFPSFKSRNGKEALSQHSSYFDSSRLPPCLAKWNPFHDAIFIVTPPTLHYSLFFFFFSFAYGCFAIAIIPVLKSLHDFGTSDCFESSKGCPGKSDLSPVSPARRTWEHATLWEALAYFFSLIEFLYESSFDPEISQENTQENWDVYGGKWIGQLEQYQCEFI